MNDVGFDLPNTPADGCGEGSKLQRCASDAAHLANFVGGGRRRGGRFSGECFICRLTNGWKHANTCFVEAARQRSTPDKRPDDRLVLAFVEARNNADEVNLRASD